MEKTHSDELLVTSTSRVGLNYISIRVSLSFVLLFCVQMPPIQGQLRYNAPPDAFEIYCVQNIVIKVGIAEEAVKFLVEKMLAVHSFLENIMTANCSLRF